jgi:hypothetical protein
MQSDPRGGPDNEPERSVLDAFDYARPPSQYDDEPEDRTNGTDSHAADPDTDQPTAPLVFAVSVSNPAGTINATATISGWLQRIELTPDVRSMTEYELARDIVATAQLASVKGQASQHTLVQDMLTYQGLDHHAARDYIDQYMNLPAPDQAAAAEAQARARYLRGEY